ncbi:UNVERIFIED_CONTAM: hypothetical protein Sradi_6199900 [Sesamum radiatum]|uniref:Uncharacterized protein n=1 Tax=Sesamum radiatum TaxID=300843 RepID=A0AAW2KA29_SESRA
MVIRSPSNPKRLIDMYLELLIEELQILWHVGVLTHDNVMNQAFMMRAAFMWIVNDLLAYGIASEWSIAGIMGCPVCMDDTRYSICSTIGMHATLTATDCFFCKIIPTAGTRKHSLRIEWKGRLHGQG